MVEYSGDLTNEMNSAKGTATQTHTLLTQNNECSIVRKNSI